MYRPVGGPIYIHFPELNFRNNSPEYNWPGSRIRSWIDDDTGDTGLGSCLGPQNTQALLYICFFTALRAEAQTNSSGAVVVKVVAVSRVKNNGRSQHQKKRKEERDRLGVLKRPGTTDNKPMAQIVHTCSMYEDSQKKKSRHVVARGMHVLIATPFFFPQVFLRIC